MRIILFIIPNQTLNVVRLCLQLSHNLAPEAWTHPGILSPLPCVPTSIASTFLAMSFPSEKSRGPKNRLLHLENINSSLLWLWAGATMSLVLGCGMNRCVVKFFLITQSTPNRRTQLLQWKVGGKCPDSCPRQKEYRGTWRGCESEDLYRFQVWEVRLVFSSRGVYILR